MRPAFTLVELLIAIVVLTIGLIALAATAGLVASRVGDGGRLTTAAHVARSILDSLTATNCEAVTSGAELRGGVTATWSASRDSSTTLVNLDVRYNVRRGARTDSFRALVPCVAQ